MSGIADSPQDHAVAIAGDLRAVLGKLSRHLRAEAAPNDLTPSQKAALSHLERNGPATISGLAREEAVRPQSMSVTVLALEEAGLVQRSADPSDARKNLFSLTPACVEMLRVARLACEDRLLRAMRSKLDLSEQKDLARAVRLLARLAD